MDTDFEIIKASVPQKTSNTEQWISWWNLLSAYYGKTMAATVFAMTWKDRGGAGATADVVKLRAATGVPLDNQTVLDSAETVAQKGLSYVESISTYYKYGLYAVGGVLLLFALGITIRVITASAKDVGTVVGTAAKAAV